MAFVAHDRITLNAKNLTEVKHFAKELGVVISYTDESGHHQQKRKEKLIDEIVAKVHEGGNTIYRDWIARKTRHDSKRIRSGQNQSTRKNERERKHRTE